MLTLIPRGRFDYSTHKTYRQAEEALLDYYASGEVCEGEHPDIERRTGPDGKPRFAVVVDD